MGQRSGGEGTGSGCSADDAKPSWQTDTGCAKRTDNDVAAVADPNTGVAVYDTYSQGGWLEVGGTSASSPIIAAHVRAGGHPGRGHLPVVLPVQHTANLFDVTSGADGSCSPPTCARPRPATTARPGWGTPDGIDRVQRRLDTGNTVTVTNPGNQTGTVGTAVSLQISATDSASGQTLTYSATGLPAGLSINSSHRPDLRHPDHRRHLQVTVTAKDTTGATGSATFTWTISPASGNTVTVTSPGSQTGTVGQRSACRSRPPTRQAARR